MVIKFCEQLLAQIRARKASVADTITAGIIKNFEEYKRLSGLLEGYKDADDIITTLYKEMSSQVDLTREGVRDDKSGIEFY